MNEPISILYVDDNPLDRELVRDALEKEHGGFRVTEAGSRADFEARLAAGDYDLVLSDFNILGFLGLQVLDTVHAKNPHLPVIIVTGTGSEEVAVEALKRGAADYVIKTPTHIQRLPQTIQAALKKISLEEERDRLFNYSLDLLSIAGFDGLFKQLNPAWEKTLGWTKEELLSKPYLELVHPDDREATIQAAAKLVAGEKVFSFDNRYRCQDGNYKWISWNSYPLVKEGLVFAVARDITERRQAEDLTRLRLTLLEFASTHSLSELLQKTLDEIGTLTNSPIGFYHFVERDQKSLTLQAWSTRTVKEFCKAEGKEKHYAIDQAGVWVDCVQERRPVIHNDYQSLPHRKGMPEGHATVIRELVVPIMRSDQIVAILGVGNKPTDYTEKDAAVVSYLAYFALEITERKRAEKALRESEDKYRRIVENSRDLIYIISPEGHFLFLSPAVSHLLGYDEAALLGRPFQTIIHPDDVAACEENLRRNIEEGVRNIGFEYRVRHASGEWRWHTTSGSAVRDEQGKMRHFEGIARDITEHRTLEEQLRQAQKMEAVGRLAGGVAHDFNNLLTIVLGNGQMALMDMGPSDPFYTAMSEIKESGNKAAMLTRQLLAFSRKQVFHPEVVNLNEVVPELKKILRRLIGEDIELNTVMSPELGLVEADAGQIEQVVMNLVVNARDAMPGGGKLTIETANADLDEAYAAGHVSVIPGPYVMFSVSDTGTGMSREVQSRVFEPFFTTKEKGKGTGLGLSMVYGIVKQSRGYIWVYSEEGQGTTFKIYLPRVTKEEEKEKGKRIKSEVRSGSETVMVVEDEESVRNLAMKILQGYGYTVLTAGNGQEAMEIFGRHDGPIHLMLTDVVMPRMGGKELAEKLKRLHPTLKVLFMSGYTDNAIVHHGFLDKGLFFIQKPFMPEDLARKVREALEK